MTVAEFEHYATLIAVVIVPTLVAVSHPIAKASRKVAKCAEATPAKWDDKPARALLWLCVGFEANADRLSRFVAFALPLAQRTRDAIRDAQPMQRTPAIERAEGDEQ